MHQARKKWGGYGKKALLALAAASAIFCGGLVNVGATVHVNEGTGVTSEVYTTGETYNKTEVDNALTAKGAATDVATNKADIANLKTAVGDAGSGLTKAVADQKADIATNRANINNLDGKLANLTTTVNGKADEADVNNKLAQKANQTAVTALDGRVGSLETTVGDASSGLVKDVADLKNQGNDLNTAIGNKADQSGLDAANAKITVNEGKITDLQAKTANLSADGKELTGMTTVSGAKVSGDNVEAGALKVTGEISNGTVNTTLEKIDESMTQTATNKDDITTLKTKTDGQQTAINGLDKKTTKITYDAALGTNVDGVTFNAGKVTGVTSINGTKIGTQEGGTYIHQDNSIWGNMKNVDTQVTTNADNIKKNKDDITALDTKVGTVNTGTYLDPTKSVGENLGLLDAGLKQETADRKAAIGELAVNGNYIEKDKNVSNNLVKLDNQAKANADEIVKTNERTGGIKRNTEKTQTTIEDSVKVDKQGNVKDVNELSAKTITTTEDADLKGNVTLGTNAANTVTVNGTADFNEAVNMDKGLTVTNGETNLKKTKVDGDLIVTGTITTDKMIFGDKATNNYTEIDKGHITSKNDVLAGDATKKSSSMELDHSKLEVGVTDKDSNGHLTMTADQTSIKNSDLDGKNYSEIVADKDSVKTTVKDEKDNTTSTESSATEIRNYAKDKDGNESSIVQTGKDITNTAEKGTITNTAKDIVNNATGDMKNDVGGKLTTTVAGQATENFNGGLDTTVTGTEKHTVNGKQINTVTEGQENIISGGQTNAITGGQINNITGDQTTTITGNKKETVTENVTEDYKKDLTTTVGGNETHEVKGTKTETVEGKLTENFKGGQETNVTGDQTTNVSGTQTTTATDINRNASSSMIDTVENASGSNKETKVVGKTTTEVKLASGKEGTYIRGATESRDYLINGTLKNSETKTAEATSTEITDGTNKASTIQKVTDLAGSVTNGTETGVSGIHANDNSVSIDSIVTDGNKYSVINQKKGSIQSTVVDGTNSTVILQDKDNVTIASSNGTVGIVGKDIVNNAQNTITNTAGTSITNQVNDSKVTTDANGTTFENNTPAVSDGGATTTKINGNQITTGRVNANELAVSDKDGDNTADFSVKAGEGVKASAGNGTTTGSLDVTAEEVTTSIKSGSKENTVISTVDGTSFINSEAAAPVTGASGANPGTADRTTIKGNTITTGKVTMDYAEVMKDLGVRGNANITGKTTTGSLEVTGTSTLKGDVTMESNATVNGNFSVGGNTNLKNTEVDGTLNVTQKATFGDSVSIAKDLSVGGDVTANSYKVGDKTYIDANGIHANGQKITDVADGSISEGSKDAVNGGQLYGVKRDLEHQVDKVGANAAAMANLRPMEFDPSSKWNIAAAIGNYGSETAAALGAFYRPNDDVMVNLSTAFGTGENMVGGGVSVRLGKGGNKLSREENNALKDQVNDLTARMDALLSVLNPNMSKDFPDVPENHWAYEAVSRLAGNDIVQGYPDGEFHGERTMTRYEMAEIIYNALSRGAEAERELVEEFKPELQAMAASEKATAEKAEG